MSWLPMHSGHPLMVHLPLTALPLAVVFDVVAIRRPEQPWRKMATVLWLLGLAGTVAAITTGLIAYDRVEHSEAGHAAMTLHRNLVLIAAAILLLNALIRWRRPNWRPAVLLGAAGAIGIAAAGYLGGEVVFRHAIGIPTEVLEEVMRERGGHSHHETTDESSEGYPHPDTTGHTH